MPIYTSILSLPGDSSKILGISLKKQQEQNYLLLQQTQADSPNPPHKHFPSQGHAV